MRSVLLLVCVACSSNAVPDIDAKVTDQTGTVWRSSLYPASWTPAYTTGAGLFLHDFSYAGYRHGESLPLVSGPVFNVLDYGADATGQQGSASSIQLAINAAAQAGGGVVYLPAGRYVCHGNLSIRDSGIVLRGDGAGRTFVHFTRLTTRHDEASVLVRPRQFHRESSLSLVVDGISRAHHVDVASGADVAVGDDIAIGWRITDAFIGEHDRMEHYWRTAGWQPFFRRLVTALDDDGHRLRIFFEVPLRYPAKMRDAASVRVARGYLSAVGIESMSLSDVVPAAEAYRHDRKHLLRMIRVRDAWVQNVDSYRATNDSAHLQSCGVLIEKSKRVTVSDCNIAHSQNRGDGGDGYLFEAREANEILFRDNTGDGGRHNFIINGGFGSSGIVFLRNRSSNSRRDDGIRTYSETHRALAMAVLWDGGDYDEGITMENRHRWSSGAGHTATESVIYNVGGRRVHTSWQAGMGYIIAPRARYKTELAGFITIGYTGTEPEDFAEPLPAGKVLSPQSLYEDQRQRRLGGAEQCRDGIDNDGDSLIDCADDDCAIDPACASEQCDDGIDNDGDGLIDCADNACQRASFCASNGNCAVVSIGWQGRRILSSWQTLPVSFSQLPATQDACSWQVVVRGRGRYEPLVLRLVGNGQDITPHVFSSIDAGGQHDVEIGDPWALRYELPISLLTRVPRVGNSLLVQLQQPSSLPVEIESVELYHQ